jgi:hypothetical protein
MGMGMGVNPYPPVYMGDPVGLFLCRGYGYGVVIPGGYLPIAISIPSSGTVLRVGRELARGVYQIYWLVEAPPDAALRESHRWRTFVQYKVVCIYELARR